MIKDVEKIITTLEKNKKEERLCSWDEIIYGLRRFPVNYIYPKPYYNQKIAWWKRNVYHVSELTDEMINSYGLRILKRNPVFACAHAKIWVTTLKGALPLRPLFYEKILICPKCGVQLSYKKVHNMIGIINYHSFCTIEVSFKTAEQLTKFRHDYKRESKKGLRTEGCGVYGWAWDEIISSDGKTATYHCFPQNSFTPFFEKLCKEYPDIEIRYVEHSNIHNQKISGSGNSNGYTQTGDGWYYEKKTLERYISYFVENKWQVRSKISELCE